MMPTTTAQMCAAVHGTLCGDGALTVSEISTDSRSIGPGAWFVPLTGERFDGHDYIDMALDRGAAGCFCARMPETVRPDKTYILVENTRTALRDLAGWYRGQFNIPVVQITGSMGKTTLKELLAGVLSERFCTLKTPGNLNGDIGAPLTLLGLTRSHQAAVIETGMDEFGQIRALGQAVTPDVAIITCVDDVHLSHFQSREDILRAKAEIFENLRPGGLAVLGGDDPLLNTLRLDCDVARCGLGEGCNVRLTDLEDLGLAGIKCTVVTEKARYPLDIPSPGVHMAVLAAIAAAAAERLGLTAEEICRGIAGYAPADNRLRVERLTGGRIMINDSYNANPRSVRADLAILAKHTGGKRIAVLGDMTELGSAEESGHRDVGRTVGELGIEMLLAVGERSKKWMVPAAKEAGCADVRWFASRDEARDALLPHFAPGDAVLLKASHFICRFDLMADYLREYQF